jgi:hypothetical protein
MSKQEYIAILFIDCNYDTARARKAWLQLRFGKDFADELTSDQAHDAIEQLKGEKDILCKCERRRW